MTPLVEEIKADLRACATVAEVNAVAKNVGGEVAAMAAGGDPSLRAMANQIRNLAAWRRWCIAMDKAMGTEKPEAGR